MTRDEFQLSLKRKPVPFTTTSGLKVDLRPITRPERKAIWEWLASEEKSPDRGQKLQCKYFALGVCNSDGEPLYKEEEVEAVPISAPDFDEICDEVARRAKMLPEKDEGKPSPANPT